MNDCEYNLEYNKLVKSDFPDGKTSSLQGKFSPFDQKREKEKMLRAYIAAIAKAITVIERRNF